MPQVEFTLLSSMELDEALPIKIKNNQAKVARVDKKLYKNENIAGTKVKYKSEIPEYNSNVLERIIFM